MGALFPMFAILLSPEGFVGKTVMIVGVLSLAILGAVSSYFAGTSIIRGSLRVTIWGVIAMAFASFIGSFFNVSTF